MLRLILALLALGALAPQAAAQYRSSPFSYNYLDVNYALIELQDTLSSVPELDGFGGRLSFDSPEGVRILLSYDEAEAEAAVGGTLGNVTVMRQDLEAGVGFITSPTDAIDLVLDVKYLRGELQHPTSDNAGTGLTLRNSTRSGYGVEFGMRSLITEWLEFDLSGEYREYFISEIGGRAGLVLMFTDNFGLQARYTYFESQHKLVGGLRLAI